jgi:hypothetical protein
VGQESLYLWPEGKSGAQDRNVSGWNLLQENRARGPVACYSEPFSKSIRETVNCNQEL